MINVSLHLIQPMIRQLYRINLISVLILVILVNVIIAKVELLIRNVIVSSQDMEHVEIKRKNLIKNH